MKRCLRYYLLLFAILPALLLPGCASVSDTLRAAEPAKKEAIHPQTEGVSLHEIAPVVPASRLDTEWWAERLHEKNDLAKKDKYQLIFIGDSITHGWEGDGKDVWTKYYAPRKALNLGFGGDRTQHVLWRLQNGNFVGQEPKLCVLMIGTNNYRADPSSEIADGIGAIVDEIRKRSPTSKVLILAIFPRLKEPGPVREKLADASQRASQWADGENVFYLDIGDAFLEADGTLSEDIMPDFLHPNKKGYRIWAEAIEPTLRRLLDE